MADDKNILLGILAIILGILVIAFPLLGVFTANILAGFAIFLLGVWFISQSLGTWEESKGSSIVSLILGIMALILGIGLFGDIAAFSLLASFWLFLVGFFLIFSGITSFFVREGTIGKGVGGLGVILGILYIILASYAWNPYYLALIIGIWLIIDGIALFFINPSDLTKA